MMCNSCLAAVIVVALVIAALALLMFQVVRTLVGIVVAVVLLGVLGLSVYVNEGARIGIALGLLLGVLLGPARLSGVDFRQWFMDPSAPSEIGDDSFVGLIRFGFHGLWMPALAAIVWLLCSLSLWMPQACTLHDPSWLWQPFSGSVMYLDRVVEWLIGVLSACAGFPAGINVVLGAMLGVVVGPILAELVWHRGLVAMPPPGPAENFLAPHALPNVRRKDEVQGRRRLIICCDGTWNWPESKRETNVVRMVRALLPEHNGVSQIIHYHEGVGTGNFLDRLLGGSTGVGLSASVKACYGFLVDNYQLGDEIFLFGFSRGAFVVRALGGMISAVGMMRKDEMARFADVWSWYCLGKDVRRERMDDLRKLAPLRHQDVDIECIGVWDTVGALGVPGTRLCAQAFEFHDTALGRNVRHAFQALAIDERRGNFQGAVWVPPNPTWRRRRVRLTAQPPQHDGPPQVLRQVWFPGVHSNVGGGYPQHGMSDTTFIWMLDQVRGLLGFDEANIAKSLDNGGGDGAPQNNNERYPGGRLEDSRTIFWKLIACPVPRPVGLISATECVHASAWDRGDANPPVVPADDVYKTADRRRWIESIGLLTARTDYEERIAELPRQPDPPPVYIRATLGACGQILKFINPQG